MTRLTGWLGTCAGLVLMVASCGARDSSNTDGADASVAVPSYSPTPEQQVRAAYVSARQAESATDPVYAFRQAGNAMEAVHPETHMQARVTGDGVTLSRAGEPWSARLHTASIGCHGERSEGRSGDPSAVGLRMTEARNGVQVDKSLGDQHFTEWYVQGPLGLEQGWTLRDNPCASGAVELRVDVAGLAVADGKDGIELRDESGQNKARYTDAWARDAKGRSLETTMSASDGSIAIHVDTRGATFPVEVDPLAWFQQQELTASDGVANDLFGSSVAVSGGIAVVGAYNRTVGANAGQGAAYVFVQSGTTWSQQQKLTASDGAANDQFGSSVAVSGGTVVVGAYQNTVGFNAGQGAAYVFVQSGTTWSQQQKLTASDGAINDWFGNAVAVSGGTAVVGAYGRTVGSNVAQGAAYVFVQSGTTWSQQQKLSASDGAANDQFGYSVAVSGGTAVVGAFNKTVGSNASQGAAYVFVQSGTTWPQQQRLTASDGATKDLFASSVAVSGGTAVVGAIHKTVGANANQGAAYVFMQSGTTWSQQQKLTSSDGAAEDSFGFSVAVSSGTAVVGAQQKTLGANTNQGAAYVFVQSGSVWSEQQKLTASDGAAFDYFGSSVAVSGGTAVVAAPSKTSNQGATYVFIQAPSSGTPCTKPSDCGSGFCVDALCCDTPCNGICQACAAAVKQSGKDDGICGPALAGSNPHKDACPADLPITCGRDGLCDGSGKCRAYYPSGTTCTTTCSGDKETDSACDGSGKCLLLGPKACGNYLCDATRCKTSCTAKTDCGASYACDPLGKCVAGATCVGNESHGADGKVVLCTPYQCDTNGTCKSTCNSVDDCVAPAACNPSGKCVPPAASSNSGGCSTSGGSGTTATIAAFLLMGAITRLRRRTRRNRKMS